jgi:DNA-directed RNA polymerase subunit L
MKLKIVKAEKNHLEMKVGGEGHTLLNLLQSSLLAHKNVTMAGYSKPHPLMDHSLLYFNTKGRKTPKKILVESAEDARKRMNSFLADFNAQIEKAKA